MRCPIPNTDLIRVIPLPLTALLYLLSLTSYLYLLPHLSYFYFLPLLFTAFLYLLPLTSYLYFSRFVSTFYHFPFNATIYLYFLPLSSTAYLLPLTALLYILTSYLVEADPRGATGPCPQSSDMFSKIRFLMSFQIFLDSIIDFSNETITFIMLIDSQSEVSVM